VLQAKLYRGHQCAGWCLQGVNSYHVNQQKLLTQSRELEAQYGKLAYCVLHAQYIAVLQYRCGYFKSSNTKSKDMFSKSRTSIELGFHKEKEHSHSSDPVLVHTIHAICCNIHVLLYAIHVYWYVEVYWIVWRIAILLHIDLY